jgi:hypothetical protein
MKSIILKTLAAASLVAAAQAEVHVLGAVWKERGVNAPEGTIIPNPGTVSAVRGYLIFDETLMTATPGPGTLIDYRDVRSKGVIKKTYTIHSDFRAFTADVISGQTGGRRIYGHIYAPVTVADVTDVMMPFSGSPFFSTGYPRQLSFDNTVFQTGSVTGLTGPRVFNPDGTLKRSLMSGSANSINIEATTIAGATAELEARLIKSGFSRAAVAPVIVTDLPATLALQDGQVQSLSVGLGPDVYPTPTYRWFRNDVQVATGATFNVVGGAVATGAGTYRVEVSTAAGTDVSATTTVTPLAYTIATNLPAAVTLIAQNSIVLSVVLNPVPITQPTYKWFKGAVALSDTIGGTSPTFRVIGGEAATGTGTYRVEVTSTAGTLVSANSVVTVNATVGTNFAFTVNTPRTFAAPFATPTDIPGGTVNPASVPAIASRQWFKAPTSDPTNFVAILPGEGGISPTFKVVGDVAASNGPGVYRLVVTSATNTTITSVDTVVTSGP